MSKHEQQVGVGNKVIVAHSTFQGASDYVGQEGKVISINRKLAHGVKFKDGEVWFYRREDLRRPA